jgi:hypothetical protein
MEENRSRETKSCSAIYEIPFFYGNRKLIFVVTVTQYWALSRFREMKSTLLSLGFRDG